MTNLKILNGVFDKINKGKIFFNYNLSKLTSFKVGGPAEVFYKPYNEAELSNFLYYLPNHIPVRVLGNGSNVLIPNDDVKGVVIKLGRNFNYISSDNNKIIVGAATLNCALSNYCLINSIKNLEFLSGIPGSIGGSAVMNAGCFGSEMKDIILELEIITRKGLIKKVNTKSIKFSYRDTELPVSGIITKVVLKKERGDIELIKNKIKYINKKRKLSQPYLAKTAGSSFTNPKTSFYKAWELIDMVGLRGYIIGGAQVSTVHSNFLINLGNATSSDIEVLGELIQNKVYAAKNINLQWEIKKIGNKDSIIGI